MEQMLAEEFVQAITFDCGHEANRAYILFALLLSLGISKQFQLSNLVLGQALLVLFVIQLSLSQ